MDFFFWFDTTNLGWSIVHIRGVRLLFSKHNVTVFLCLKIFLFLYSVDPDEMQDYAAFHLDLHCLQKNLFRDFLNAKD